MKKLISAVLAMVMLFSMATVALAQTTEASSETVYLNGKETAFNVYILGTSRFVKYTDESGTHVTEFNMETNTLWQDGKIVDFSVTNPSIDFDANTYGNVRLKNNWVLYDTKSGNIGTDIRDVGTIAAAIIAVCGVAAGVATAVATVVISRGCDSIDYTTEYYYIDPVTTSRPVIAKKYYFYDGDTGKLLKTADNRY